MKQYVHTEFVPEKTRHYLTPNKLYEVKGDRVKIITSDSNTRSVIFIPESSHLDNRPWTLLTLVDEMEDTQGRLMQVFDDGSVWVDGVKQ